MYYTEIIQLINTKYRVDYIFYKVAILINQNQNLKYKYENNIISISRDNYMLKLGGTSKFIGEFNSYIKNRNILHTYISESKINKLKENIFIVVDSDKQEYAFRKKDFYSLLVRTESIIIHNLIDVNLRSIATILKNFKGIIYYYLHDFSSVCKNIKLMKNDKYHCEVYNNIKVCDTCKYKKEKEVIFNFHNAIFSLKNIILIAPSENTKKIFDSIYLFNKDKILVKSHDCVNILKRKEKFNVERVKIAYVGYKAYEKGWEVFKSIALKYRKKYDFYILGKCDEKLEYIKQVDVSFLKDGKNAMVKALVNNKINISFLWSIWPETYSYTYYESLEAGTYVISNKLSGNIYDEILKNGNGIILNDSTEIEKFLKDDLITCLNKYNRIYCEHRGMNKEIVNKVNEENYE